MEQKFVEAEVLPLCGDIVDEGFQGERCEVFGTLSERGRHYPTRKI
jgi:hypothetical protein